MGREFEYRFASSEERGQSILDNNSALMDEIEGLKISKYNSYLECGGLMNKEKLQETILDWSKLLFNGDLEDYEMQNVAELLMVYSFLFRELIQRKESFVVFKYD